MNRNRNIMGKITAGTTITDDWDGFGTAIDTTTGILEFITNAIDASLKADDPLVTIDILNADSYEFLKDSPHWTPVRRYVMVANNGAVSEPLDSRLNNGHPTTVEANHRFHKGQLRGLSRCTTGIPGGCYWIFSRDMAAGTFEWVSAPYCAHPEIHTVSEDEWPFEKTFTSVLICLINEENEEVGTVEDIFANFDVVLSKKYFSYYSNPETAPHIVYNGKTIRRIKLRGELFGIEKTFPDYGFRVAAFGAIAPEKTSQPIGGGITIANNGLSIMDCKNAIVALQTPYNAFLKDKKKAVSEAEFYGGDAIKHARRWAEAMLDESIKKTVIPNSRTNISARYKVFVNIEPINDSYLMPLNDTKTGINFRTKRGLEIIVAVNETVGDIYREAYTRRTEDQCRNGVDNATAHISKEAGVITYETEAYWRDNKAGIRIDGKIKNEDGDVLCDREFKRGVVTSENVGQLMTYHQRDINELIKKYPDMRYHGSKNFAEGRPVNIPNMSFYSNYGLNAEAKETLRAYMENQKMLLSAVFPHVKMFECFELGYEEDMLEE